MKRGASATTARPVKRVCTGDLAADDKVTAILSIDPGLRNMGVTLGVRVDGGAEITNSLWDGSPGALDPPVDDARLNTLPAEFVREVVVPVATAHPALFVAVESQIPEHGDASSDESSSDGKCRVVAAGIVAACTVLGIRCEIVSAKHTKAYFSDLFVNMGAYEENKKVGELVASAAFTKEEQRSATRMEDEQHAKKAAAAKVWKHATAMWKLDMAEAERAVESAKGSVALCEEAVKAQPRGQKEEAREALDMAKQNLAVAKTELGMVKAAVPPKNPKPYKTEHLDFHDSSVQFFFVAHKLWALDVYGARLAANGLTRADVIARLESLRLTLEAAAKKRGASRWKN